MIVCLHVCMPLCVCVYMCVCMPLCVYVCMCVYVCEVLPSEAILLTVVSLSFFISLLFRNISDGQGVREEKLE